MVKENVLIHGFAGVAGSFSIQILYPFDVIKTRAQAYDKNSKFNNVNKYENFFKTGKEIIKNEGFKSLFKGLGISMVASNISYGLFFGLYRWTKNRFDYIENNKLKNFLSGFVSSVIAIGIVQPLWTLKTRKIVDKKEFGKNSYKIIIKNIYERDHIRGFYRGYFLSLILGMNAVIQLSFYDSVKDYFKESRLNTSNLFTFFNGVFSRMFATLAMYPFNTVRTKFQQNQYFEGLKNKKYNNIREVFKYIYKNEGINGFYRGIVPHFYRSMPSNGLFFIVYENSIKWLNDLKKK